MEKAKYEALKEKEGFVSTTMWSCLFCNCNFDIVTLTKDCSGFFGVFFKCGF